jgi:hypothetical protein
MSFIRFTFRCIGVSVAGNALTANDCHISAALLPHDLRRRRLQADDVSGAMFL